ncbi:MAG TPA: IPT/TIG domain-containing protein, partial [Bacteroidia bacterium]|nr:IPT/TIG domain-containing protein [Bacteroidia bacterium]
MNSYRLFIIILGVVYLSSCRKKDKDECPVCPIVDNVFPASGHAGDTVTINGSQFGASGNIVKINDVSAEVISENSSQVRAKVPRNCGSGPVSVDIDDELTSNRSVGFIYIKRYTVTTFAGTPLSPGDLDGAAGLAKFNGPKGIVADKLGNVYV